MDASLFKSLDEGVTLLCASQRLAHRLRLDYAHHAQTQGRTAWLTPKILTFNAYLANAFAQQRQHQVAPLHLLNELQAQIVWEAIVADSNHVLLSPSQTARAAQRSWQLLHQYQVPLEELSAADSEEARVFYQWSRAFLQYTGKHHQLDTAQLPVWIRHSRHVPDAGLHLAGFDFLPPAFSALLDHWRQHGCAIHVHDMLRQNTNAQVITLRDADEELNVAARWSRHQIEQGIQRIGVVVPDLNVNAARVKRIFTSILAPPSCSTLHHDVAPFSLASSAILSSYPLVHHALLCLQLLREKNDFANWEKILRSPFIAGYEDELGERALLDIIMRKSHREQWTLQEVSRLAAPTCPTLAQSLHAVAELKGTIHGRHLPSQWTAHFNKLLTIVGWAQGRSLSSDEQQARNKFHEVIAQLSGLDEVTRQVNDTDALQLLRSACQQSRFAAETPDEAVTIIDADTAAGMYFDALWIMGVHADAWPAATDPDPFIPLHLQRQHGMAASRADTVLQTAKHKLQRLVNSATEVIVSWPQHDKDVELRPSSLLQWPATSLEAVPYSDVMTLSQALMQSKPVLENFADANLPSHPGGSIRQGSKVFELQSRCAFRAQAELRLFATSPEPLIFGISPLDRGKLVHAVLQELWNQLRDSQGLRVALQSTSRLRARLEQIVSGKAQHLIPATTLHQQHMVRAEVNVAVNVIMQLLYHESERETFSVQSNEQREPLELEGLKFHIQPDRIDRLADGALLLIDYKTGETNRPQDWLDINETGRPRSPQLPLYALAHSKPLSGIAYAIVAPGTAELLGFADRDGIAGGIRDYSKRSASRRIPGIDTWPQLLQHWSEVMNVLASQFKQGIASVNPLPNECQYCTLTGLCRIKEHLVEAQAEDDDND